MSTAAKEKREWVAMLTAVANALRVGDHLLERMRFPATPDVSAPVRS